MTAVLRVALPAPLPRWFDYLSPGDQATPLPGSRVEVPFGRARRVGIVVAQVASSDIPHDQLKPALRVLDDTPLFTAELLANLLRAGDYWCGAVGEVLFGALPSWLRADKPLPRNDDEAWQLTKTGRSARDARSRRGSSAWLLDALAESPQRSGDLDALLPGWRGAARRLRGAGLIECVALQASRVWQAKPRTHPLTE